VRRANTQRPDPEFEDEPAERIVTLDVWDSRFGPMSATPSGRTVNSGGNGERNRRNIAAFDG
jgi:hypothetical protein